MEERQAAVEIVLRNLQDEQPPQRVVGLDNRAAHFAGGWNS